MKKKLPGYCNENLPVPRVLCHSLTEVTEFLGKGRRILPNFRKFRVRVQMPFRTSISSGYCGPGVQNSQQFQVGTKTCCTRTPGIVATGVQNFQKFWVQT